MKGPKIFTFALENIPAVIKETLDKNLLKMEDIDLFVFHQANKFMLDYIRRKINIPQDKFFMYFEDWDLSRRMHKKYKTIYYPLVSVYHGYESGANKSFKLFIIFLRSAFIYFNKWGWFFDKERKQFNKATLAQFKK